MELPPLHPILVNFTAALVPVSVVSDVLGRILRRPTLHAVGWWTLLYAALITPLTVLAGWLWLRSVGDVDEPAMEIHQWLGTALAVVLALMILWRGRLYRRSVAPPASYLVFAFVVLGALAYQGHLGGTMSFGGNVTAPSREHAPATKPGSVEEQGIHWRDHLDLP